MGESSVGQSSSHDQFASEEALLISLAAHVTGGGLVAFPTETVYGLGANAFDREAVLRVFQAKGRPLTNPLICHVTGFEDARRLCDEPIDVMTAFRIMAGAFWPGPLSVIVKASHLVPAEVTAFTGYVAIRCPSHSLTVRLIDKCGVPLVGPSANKFGHISPTCAAHVVEEFIDVPDIRILDGGSCNVGIESSVVKIEIIGHDSRLPSPALELTNCTMTGIVGCDAGRMILRFTMLRRGYVTCEMLKSLLSNNQQIIHKYSLEFIYANLITEEVNTRNEMLSLQQCPGMLVRHYSPVCPTYLLRRPTECMTRNETSHVVDKSYFTNVVLVDFFKEFSFLEPFCFAYFGVVGTDENLWLSSVIDKGIERCYSILRQAEFICMTDGDVVKVGNTDDMKSHPNAVWVCDASTKNDSVISIMSKMRCIVVCEFDTTKYGEKGLALYDRIDRATAGLQIRLQN